MNGYSNMRQPTQWQIMQQVAEAREREQARQEMINQWAKEGNNGALFGNLLSSMLMKYLGNRDDYRPDTTPATPYDGRDTTNQLLTGAMNEQMGATPQDLAYQAMYGKPQTPQINNPADGAAATIEEWIKKNRTSRPKTSSELWQEELFNRYYPLG